MLLTVTTREPAVVSKPVEQQAGEGEVPEVVGAELELEPVRGRAPRRVHQAGVVDQQVDPLVIASQVIRGRADRVQRGQVQPLDGHVGARAASWRSSPRRLLAFVDGADGEHDGRARAASSRAVSNPSPVLAPVTTAVRPVWSGMSLAVHVVIGHRSLRFSTVWPLRLGAVVREGVTTSP